MCGLLPMYGRHPTCDDKLCQDVHNGVVKAKAVSAIMDTRASGVLVTLSTVQRKGLQDQIDSSHKVTISQASAAQKFQTYGVLKGGVPYQMMSAHGRSLTITLPCHVAPVGSDLIGSNEQGPLLQGIKGIVYAELSRPDGRRATFMQMPDGEVVGLPANTQGMTVLPEIGQESQWVVQSHPMGIPELCDFLMSRERVCQQREAMPDLESDSTASIDSSNNEDRAGGCWLISTNAERDGSVSSGRSQLAAVTMLRWQLE